MPEGARVLWMLEQVEQLEKQFESAQDKITDRCEKMISDFFGESLDLPKKIKNMQKSALDIKILLIDSNQK